MIDVKAPLRHTPLHARVEVASGRGGTGMRCMYTYIAAARDRRSRSLSCSKGIRATARDSVQYRETDFLLSN